MQAYNPTSRKRSVILLLNDDLVLRARLQT